MITASPITRQTVGRTFIIAISALGLAALAQLGALVWVFVARSHTPTLTLENSLVRDETLLTATVRATPPPGLRLEADPVADPLLSPDHLAALDPPAPKPTPLRASMPAVPEPEQSLRYKEAISQGKLLRDRGDMSAALTRFREAAAMNSSPEAIFEIAITYEKMQLNDRAAEQWRRIYEMGESSGPYYAAAEARLRQVKDAAMRAALQNLPAQGAPANEEGIPPGKTLGLLAVTTQEQQDRSTAKHLTLRIPVKARSTEKIDVRDLTIQVLFYDMVDNQSLLQTTANVSSRWTSAPADWNDSDVETLEVNYALPLPDARAAKRESRNYFGHLVRVYYKGELQAASGEPERLVQQFPPEQKLAADTSRNP